MLVRLREPVRLCTDCLLANQIKEFVAYFNQYTIIVYIHQCEHVMELRRDNHLLKTEIETPESIFITEYVLNKTSMHVFVNSSYTFMRCVLNQSFPCF